MMHHDIIDVTEGNFDYEVLAYSQQTPVVVDFWASWCAPCRVLGPLLEKLAKEAQGSFRLAKVDVDQNPNLSTKFSIRSIPAVKAFKEGRIVSEFVGAQPEPRLREFIQALVPSEESLTIEKGYGLLAMGRHHEAETTFRKVLSTSPTQPSALLGLVKCLILQGNLGEIDAIIHSFPASRELSSLEILRPLIAAMAKLPETDHFGEDPLDAAYQNTLRLVRRGYIEAALDGLLDILRQDKHYRSGEPRKIFLGLLELLGEGHPANRPYRNELASVLF